MNQTKIDRINELAKKAREQGLSEEEIKERQILRQEYIDSFRKNLEATLDNTVIVDENGNKTKVKRKNEP